MTFASPSSFPELFRAANMDFLSLLIFRGRVASFRLHLMIFALEDVGSVAVLEPKLA